MYKESYKDDGDPWRILQKIEHFCAYQERCVDEVTNKLRSWNVAPHKIEELIERLRHDNFLNEERFARSFVRGKFHINQWGRIKIMHELRSKHIGDDNISLALNEIEPGEYLTVLHDLVMKKYMELKRQNNLIIREKILNFVTGKGYEYYLAEKIINQLNIGDDST